MQPYTVTVRYSNGSVCKCSYNCKDRAADAIARVPFHARRLGITIKSVSMIPLKLYKASA